MVVESREGLLVASPGQEGRERSHIRVQATNGRPELQADNMQVAPMHARSYHAWLCKERSPPNQSVQEKRRSCREELSALLYVPIPSQLHSYTNRAGTLLFSVLFLSLSDMA